MARKKAGKPATKVVRVTIAGMRETRLYHSVDVEVPSAWGEDEICRAVEEWASLNLGPGNEVDWDDEELDNEGIQSVWVECEGMPTEPELKLGTDGDQADDAPAAGKVDEAAEMLSGQRFANADEAQMYLLENGISLSLGTVRRLLT